MSDQEKAQEPLPPAAGSADFWAVRFETKEGMYHPVWWGEKGGPRVSRETVEKLAARYLNENKHWLTGINDIYTPNA